MEQRHGDVKRDRAHGEIREERTPITDYDCPIPPLKGVAVNSPRASLLIFVCLFGLQGCSFTPTPEPPPGVELKENGIHLNGMTAFAAEFRGTPEAQSAVTITFRAGFDPIPQAIDDEYVLNFSVTFPVGSVLVSETSVDLSSVGGLTAVFEEICFCPRIRYAMTASGILAVHAISENQITGALNAVFTLTDPLEPSPINLGGRTYSLAVQSFVANPAPPASPTGLNAAGLAPGDKQ